MSKKITPIGKNVLLKLVKSSDETQTRNGIMIPHMDSANETKARLGRVVSLGSGRNNENGGKVPFSVKVGDKVVFPPHSGTKIEGESDYEELLVLPEADILGVVLTD